MTKTTIAVALTALATAASVLPHPTARATGLATCDSGPRAGWQDQAKLEQKLKAQGWQVRRIKEDGGCYEVYGLDKDGKRVEAYFLR
ncbi:MAG: PepSY domain-containing protein [Lautropia sp.]